MTLCSEPHFKKTNRGWPVFRVDEVGRVQLGRQRTPKYQTGKHARPYLRVANVYENRFELTDVLSMDFDARDFETYCLKAGDILLNEGQSTELVGRPALWRGEISSCCFQNTLVRFQADRSKLIPEFALAVFRYYFHTGQFSQISSKTSNVAHLGSARFAAMPFPLPPLPEQRRIADILDRVEALRTKRRASLAQLDELKLSIFLESFGEEHFPTWGAKTVADILEKSPSSIRTGPFGSQLLHSEFVDSGVAVLGIDNVVTNEFKWTGNRYITEEKYRQLSRYTVKANDVLITIMGTCGRCAIVPPGIPKAINTKHLCCITTDPNLCSPEFLRAYFMLHPVARRYLAQCTKGAIMDGLNMGTIKDMPIPVPPLPLQQEFARRVQAIDRLKAKHRQSLAEMDALFASLQHRAFRGEL